MDKKHASGRVFINFDCGHRMLSTPSRKALNKICPKCVKALDAERKKRMSELPFYLKPDGIYK